MGKFIELVAGDGHQLSAYRADPGGKPRGGIVVIQEIFGVNSHIRSVAAGYAADGYLAIAPAMYDRLERNFEVGYTPEDIAKGRALKEKAGMAAALLDVEAAVKAAAQAGKVGIVGYCWGGYIAWMAAARVPGLACAAPYYGGGSTTDEAIAEQPKCPVMAHYGEKDEHISVESVKKLAAVHPAQTVHLYPAPHGFNCDQRGSYDAASAKLARERTLAFFREHIG
ncbi:MAG: dienelactone hydrolase family protein [Burkholderiales bacterium]|nr:dienelactone hydrolase family protein [Burkholderiales bacterium]